MSVNPNFLIKNPFLWGVVVVLILLFGRVTGISDVIEDMGADVSSDKTQDYGASLEGWVKVVKAVDGDTIRVSDGKDEALIRMIGVDTPESVHPTKEVECFGKEASSLTERMLLGNTVRIESDPSQGNRDKYGRLLRYVFLEDGTNFNRHLIREGYAYEYTYDDDYKYQIPFKAAQLFAQTEKKGFWADGVCEA